MKFKATEEQLKRVAAAAVNASGGFGMGMLHFRQKEYKPEEIDLNFAQFQFERNVRGVKPGINIDYYEGRMVKLYVRPTKVDGEYEVEDRSPRADYQSWAATYPTYRDLLKAGGIEV